MNTSWGGMMSVEQKFRLLSRCLGWLFCTLFFPSVSGVQAQTQARGAAEKVRFAILIGANQADASRSTLRYAQSDAESMRAVLIELGGFRRENTTLLREPTVSELSVTFEALRQSLLRTGGQREVLLYYSGHSDEEGLLLGKERFAYLELRQSLLTLGADVHIAVLDSCASGAMVRSKGGRKISPFLLSGAGDVKGHAILTSSSADEFAQESDRIGASFFTHYLLSGLRGAADSSGEGNVTLAEAYQYAFQQTLQRTQSTQSGPQHAAYDIQLSGVGDLVLTDIKKPAATLALAQNLHGRIFVWRSDGRLLAEAPKLNGLEQRFGVPKDDYRVVLHDADQVYESRVNLLNDSYARVSADNFSIVEQELTAARKGSLGVESDVQTPVLQRQPVVFSLVPGVGNAQRDAHKRSHTFGLTLLGSDYGELLGLGLAVGVQRVRGRMQGAQLALVGNDAGDVWGGIQASVAFNQVRGNGRGLLQAALSYNRVEGTLYGIQTAMGYNFAGQVKGIQIALGANRASENLDGLQWSLGLNSAGKTNGAQLGVVNKADDISGLQIGLVNVGKKVKGGQLGLINIADSVDGLPVGVINWVKDGVKHFDFYTGTSEPLNFAFKLGSKNFYTMVAAGVGSGGNFRALVGLSEVERRTRWSIGIGGGFMVPYRRVFIGGDVAFAMPFEQERFLRDLYIKPRLYAGWKAAPRFAPFIGFESPLYFDFDGQSLPRSVLPQLAIGNNAYLWPAVIAGFQI